VSWHRMPISRSAASAISSSMLCMPLKSQHLVFLLATEVPGCLQCRKCSPRPCHVHDAGVPLGRVQQAGLHSRVQRFALAAPVIDLGRHIRARHADLM
jgi:hypothetical protein